MALWINEDALFKIIDKKIIFIFDEAELELLIYKYNKIDVYDENPIMIKWVWSVVREFLGEERKKKLIKICNWIESSFI